MTDTKYQNDNVMPPWLGGIVLYRPKLGAVDRRIRPAMIVHIHPNSDADNLMDFVDVQVFSPSGPVTIARVPYIQVDSGGSLKEEGRGQWQWAVQPPPRGSGQVTIPLKAADEDKLSPKEKLDASTFSPKPQPKPGPTS